MTGGELLLGAVSQVLRPGPLRKILWPSPPRAQPFWCLQAGFLWIAVADSAALLSTTFHHSPSIRVKYTLGSRMHLVFAHKRLEAKGLLFPRSPYSAHARTYVDSGP